MMKKFILILLIIGMILPMVSAITYKEKEPITIKINCFYNGDYCGAASVCNLTVFYPNGTTLVKDGVMTNEGNYHSYLLPEFNGTSIGDYSATSICAESGESNNDNFNFEITESGKPNPSEWIILIFMALFLVISIGYMVTVIMILEDFAGANINAYSFIKYLGMYLGVMAVYYFNSQFANVVIIERILGVVIKAGLYTHGLVPIMGFGYSLIINKIKEANNARMGNG